MYTAQRHVVYLKIWFAKEAMQHVCTGAVQRAAQYVILVMQREACSSVLCIKASALSNIISCFQCITLALVLFLMYVPELLT